MATFESNYCGLFNSMESKKRENACELNCRGVPLPYLIRPRRTLSPSDEFALYNDYACDTGDESDEDVSPMEGLETGNCFGGTRFGLGNESNSSLSEMDCAVSDDEYVIVNHVDDMPDSEKERVGAIHMMDLCKDVPVSPKASVKDVPESPMASAEDVPESPMASDAVSEKDTTVDESKSDDEGSSGDEWVVV